MPNAGSDCKRLSRPAGPDGSSFTKSYNSAGDPLRAYLHLNLVYDIS
jgi:hypothetical protein